MPKPGVSFSSFVYSLYVSTLFHLGEGPEESKPDRQLARQTIDLLGILEEKTQGNLDEEEAMRITERMMSGRFTLNDMYTQMEMMSKVGTVDKLMSFMPTGMFGMGNMSKAQKEETQRNLDLFRVIMDSMTSDEKNEPNSLKVDRIRRIARGSGVTEKDVRRLIGQWKRSKKMMKGMTGNRQMSKQMKRMMKDMDGDDFDMGI